MSEPLANALEALELLQQQGVVAIYSTRDLSEKERKSLVSAGYIKQVIKGWYIPTSPDIRPGDTTPWFSSFWVFCAQYFEEKYNGEWSLSAEQSLKLHVGNQSVPTQLIVRSPKAGDKNTKFLHDTSIYDLRAQIAPSSELEIFEGLRIYRLPVALIEAGQSFFLQDELTARSALGAINSASELLPKLISGGHSKIAGRLCGAFRNIDSVTIADEIKSAMTAAGFEIRENNPFLNDLKPQRLTQNPKVNRLRYLWKGMREVVMKIFPSSPGEIVNLEDYLRSVEDVYKSDAYHSLSIEGYKVTPELIDKIRNGQWNPDENEEDQNEKNALAAQGYNLAFNEVQTSIKSVIEGAAAAKIARQQHNEWFRQLFVPSVRAKITPASILAGYRQSRVIISGSRHFPASDTNVTELMAAFFDLLEDEENAGVRVILGHFFFVYIHPFPDGNGRTARFLMNLMMASGGYPWIVVRVEQRNEYMAALEEASVNENIEPFTRFISGLIT